MALEIEYVDMDSFENVVAHDADPADLVNGDGSSVDDAVQSEPVSQEVEQATEQPEGFSPLAVVDPDGTVQKLADNMEEISLEQKRLQAEQQHQIEISAAKEDHFSLAVKRSELENELKDIKADEKAALRNLRNLIKRGPNYPQPKSKIDEAVATASEPSAIQVEDANADITWRELSLAPLLDGIKGLGAKKLEALLELCPTIGHWEELRAKAGVAHKPVSDVLPKGIGGSITDEIEERVYLAIKKHGDGLRKAKECS
jgi:hypothetical protein